MDVKQEVKFLEIPLEHKLLWNRHIQETVSKVIRALMLCRSLAGNTWSYNPRILRWMYTTIIKPIIRYNTTRQGTARNTLSKLQRLACLYIIGAMRTENMSFSGNGVMTPLHLTVQEAAEAATKLKGECW